MRSDYHESQENLKLFNETYLETLFFPKILNQRISQK